MDESTVTGPILPPELEDMVCEALNNDQSKSTLLNCALVSKRWLHQSRRHYLSSRRIFLNVNPYSDSDKLIQELLSQPDPKCTFWPYIRDVHIADQSYVPWLDRPRTKNETSPTFVSLLSMALTYASNLRTLRIEGFCYFGLPKDILSSIASNSTLSSLCINQSKFTSPNQLFGFLGSLESLKVRCKLQAVCFVDSDWDPTLSNRFLPDPSLQFQIDTDFGDSSILFKIILNHSWNITKLSLEPDSSGEFMMQDVLRHIGPSLTKLRLPIVDYDLLGTIVFNLEHNTSLEDFDIGTIAFFSSDEDPPPVDWLTSLLNTISSRGRFRSLRGGIAFNGGTEEYDGDSDVIQLFGWDLLEDVLLDQGKFPGDGPTFTLELIDNSDWDGSEDEIIWLIEQDCLPGLAHANKLEFM